MHSKCRKEDEMNKMVTSLKNKARYAANSVAPVAVMLGTAVLTSSSAFAADPKELLKFIIKTVGGLIIALGIIMFVMGMGYLGAPLIIASGVIADLIAKSGRYKSFKKTVVSYGVFCLWICANYFPVVVTADSYREGLLESGYSAEYCDNLFRAINSKTIIVLLILCFVFGCLGAFIGKAVVRKHFEKAGIV